ncbi:MAG: DMT family transporter [Chloroflexi bacterium]|nr:DMT family transporter [Chloroflexota bacterium]
MRRIGALQTEGFARWAAIPIGVASIATSSILIRLTTAPPLVTAANRLLLASVLLLGLAFITQRQDLMKAFGRFRWRMVGAGLLLALHFAMWTNALFLTSVASAVFLIDTHPAVVALLSRRALGELTSRRVWLGIGLTAVGGAAITGGDVPIGQRALLGDAMALIGALAFAGYLVIGRSVRPQLGIAAYTGVVYGLAGLTLAAAVFVSGGLLDGAGRDWPVWLALVLVPTLGGHTVLNWTLRFLPASVVGVSILGEPVGATLLAWVVLNETPPRTALLGGSLILLGLYMALRAGTREKAAG